MAATLGAVISQSFELQLTPSRNDVAHAEHRHVALHIPQPMDLCSDGEYKPSFPVGTRERKFMAVQPQTTPQQPLHCDSHLTVVGSMSQCKVRDRARRQGLSVRAVPMLPNVGSRLELDISETCQA